MNINSSKKNFALDDCYRILKHPSSQHISYIISISFIKHQIILHNCLVYYIVMKNPVVLFLLNKCLYLLNCFFRLFHYLYNNLISDKK